MSSSEYRRFQHKECVIYGFSYNFSGLDIDVLFKSLSTYLFAKYGSSVVAEIQFHGRNCKRIKINFSLRFRVILVCVYNLLKLGLNDVVMAAIKKSGIKLDTNMLRSNFTERKIDGLRIQKLRLYELGETRLGCQILEKYKKTVIIIIPRIGASDMRIIHYLILIHLKGIISFYKFHNLRTYPFIQSKISYIVEEEWRTLLFSKSRR